ncbi:MAG: hypothetical protein QOF09_4888 [Alphaproteobacteria bacterium]|jgi:Flp pilus assembly pilin Flp|nr:hypothetical protein [Alphaproteobacteria bacterium]
MKARFLGFAANEAEVAIVDYGLISALIAIATIMAVTILMSKFSGVATGL